MALSVAARRALRQTLKATHLGDEVADVVDAGSGTLSVAARRAMDFALTNPVLADGVCDKIDAGTALTGAQQDRLGWALASRVYAAEIAAALEA